MQIPRFARDDKLCMGYAALSRGDEILRCAQDDKRGRSQPLMTPILRCAQDKWALPFDYSDRLQPSNFLGEAGAVDDVDDGVHVLVGLGDFFGDAFAALGLDVDALLFQPLAGIAGGVAVLGGGAAHAAAGAVADGAESLPHRALGADEDVGGGAHGAGDPDRLADGAVARRHFGPPGGIGAGGALAVDEHFALLAVDCVLLPLGDVVADVVDDAHFGRRAEQPLDGAAGEVGDGLAVGPGEVRGASHGAEVVAAFLGVDGDAGKLPVGQLDRVPLHGLAHPLEIIRADLVAEAARAAVDEDDDLVGAQAEGGGDFRVENLFNVLHFEEVVPGAEGAELRSAALPGALGNGVGVGAAHRAFLFRALEVVAGAEAALVDHPAGAAGEDVVDFLERAAHRPFGAGAAGDVAEELVDELLDAGDDFVTLKLSREQAHAAVDVEPHAAGRDHARAHVGGRHAADGEAVALVDVGHGQRAADDAGEESDVDGLLERQVGEDLLEQRFVGVDEGVGAHPGLCALGDEPAALIELLELFERELHGSPNPLYAPRWFALSRRTRIQFTFRGEPCR